jgi:hypothetical protein
VDNLARPGESGAVHRQTATAVTGCAIQTEYGEIGHVTDVLVDDQTWVSRGLVDDTENGWVRKTMVVLPMWLTT